MDANAIYKIILFVDSTIYERITVEHTREEKIFTELKERFKENKDKTFSGKEISILILNENEDEKLLFSYNNPAKAIKFIEMEMRSNENDLICVNFYYDNSVANSILDYFDIEGVIGKVFSDASHFYEFSEKYLLYQIEDKYGFINRRDKNITYMDEIDYVVISFDSEFLSPERYVVTNNLGIRQISICTIMRWISISMSS